MSGFSLLWLLRPKRDAWGREFRWVYSVGTKNRSLYPPCTTLPLAPIHTALKIPLLSTLLACIIIICSSDLVSWTGTLPSHHFCVSHTIPSAPTSTFHPNTASLFIHHKLTDITEAQWVPSSFTISPSTRRMST